MYATISLESGGCRKLFNEPHCKDHKFVVEYKTKQTAKIIFFKHISNKKKPMTLKKSNEQKTKLI